MGLALVPGIADKHVHHLLSLGRARLTLGEEPSLHDQVRDKWECRIFASANALVCVTKDEQNALEKLYPNVEKNKTVIIPYGMTPMSSRPGQVMPTITYAGRVADSRKGVPVFLDALELLLSATPPFSYAHNRRISAEAFSVEHLSAETRLVKKLSRPVESKCGAPLTGRLCPSCTAVAR